MNSSRKWFFLEENNKVVAATIIEKLAPTKSKEAAALEADSEDALRIAAIEAVSSYGTENNKSGGDRDESKIRVAKIKASQACRKLRAAGYDDITCNNF